MKPTRAVLAAVAVFVSGFAVVPTAVAQTPGYPPAPCPITFSTQALGTMAVGQTVTFSLSPVCEWAPGTQVSVSVNGVFVGNKVPSAAGTVRVLVEAVSATLLSIDDPVLVPAQCGNNVIRAVGSSTAAQASVTHEGTFTLSCPTAPVAQPQQPRRPLAFTGDHVATLVALGALTLVAGALLVVTARRRQRPGTLA